MLYFNISITNPWSTRFSPVKSWVGITPFKNKSWEIQILKTTDIVALEFAFTTRRDHAGLRVEVGLFGYSIDFNWYDVRHYPF